jgi:hypothetical protein
MKIIYRYPKKEDREISHMQNFVCLFKDFKIEKWEKKDPPFPDFLIHKETNTIGVEHTSLINDQLMGIRNAQQKCFKLAMEMARANNLPTLVVKAKFISNSKFVNIQQSAKELYDFVVDSLPSIPNKSYFDEKPKNLQYFNWIRIRNSESHDWCEIKMVISKINPIEKIKNTIESKEKKVSNYLKHCDICWLLIGVDEFNAPEAIKLTDELNFNFESEFDRIFVLQNYKDELVELKKKCT